MKTHRDTYPEQYTDPLIGERVEIRCNLNDPDKVVATGVVERVMDTRFGRMADIGATNSDNKPVFYLARHCQTS